MTKNKADKEATTDTASAAETASGTGQAEQKPIRPKHFRKQAQKEIGKSYQKIVEKLAQEAAGGSVSHTKLLFDLGAVKEEVRAAGGKRGRRPPSLGRLLLQEVEAMKREKKQADENTEDDHCDEISEAEATSE